MRKFDLKDPIHRVGQSLVYYHQLDSIEEKCRSMQGVKGIDGTVIFSDRVKAEPEGMEKPNCSLGIILKPEELAFADKSEIAPVLTGAVSQVLPGYSARLQWPFTLVRESKPFGQLNCIVSKIKERWVYVIFVAHFHFDETWSDMERESFLQELLHALDTADQQMRQDEHQVLISAYREATGLLDQPVRVQLEERVVEGTVIEINEKSDLLIKPLNGRSVRATGKKVKGIEYLDVASK